MPGRGIDGLVKDVQRQRPHLADRPAYQRLLEVAEPLVDSWLGAALEQLWSARSFNAAYERPLLLLAALRYDALLEGERHPLHAGLVERPARLDVITEDVLRDVLERPRVRHALQTRAVQTNETTRAVTWLWPAHLMARAGVTQPLVLCDLGTSAGLNLIADALPTPWSDQLGAPLVVAPRPPIALRLGLDRAPLDVRNPEDATWLRACVWQDDVERLERLEQAFAAFAAAQDAPNAPRLQHCSLVDVGSELASLPIDRPLLLLQTVVRDYLRADERARYEGAVRAFIAARPAASVLWAQLELRPQDEPFDRSMVLAVTLREASGRMRELVLARTHPHPRVLYTNRAAIDALLEHVASP